MLITRMAVLLSGPGGVVTAAGQREEHCVSGSFSSCKRLTTFVGMSVSECPVTGWSQL